MKESIQKSFNQKTFWFDQFNDFDRKQPETNY